MHVVLGDPALVVRLGAGSSAGRVGGREGGVGISRNLLGLLADGGLGALGRGEEGFDPCLVDKVERAGEDAGEDQVEEDAVAMGAC